MNQKTQATLTMLVSTVRLRGGQGFETTIIVKGRAPVDGVRSATAREANHAHDKAVDFCRGDLESGTVTFDLWTAQLAADAPRYGVVAS